MATEDRGDRGVTGRQSPLPDLAYVKECVDYDAVSGVFTWKERPFWHFKTLAAQKTFNTRYAGTRADVPAVKGYSTICMGGGRTAQAGRVAWYISTGEDPQGTQINYKNGVRGDNRIENLRAVSQFETMSHRVGLDARNKSGHRNVHWDSANNKWRVGLKVKGKYKSFGFYKNLEDAVKVAEKVRPETFGEFQGIKDKIDVKPDVVPWFTVGGTTADPTIEQLREWFSYDAETGTVYWRVRKWTDFASHNDWLKFTETRTGKVKPIFNNGYAVVGVPGYNGTGNGKGLTLHRIAWEVQTGEKIKPWPHETIDHVNHRRSDNRFCNLRRVTHQENQCNKSLSSRNTSGFANVSYIKKTDTWKVQLGYKGERVFDCTYKTKQEAVAASIEARRRYGFHPNHGKPAEARAV